MSEIFYPPCNTKIEAPVMSVYIPVAQENKVIEYNFDGVLVKYRAIDSIAPTKTCFRVGTSPILPYGVYYDAPSRLVTFYREPITRFAVAVKTTNPDLQVGGFVWNFQEITLIKEVIDSL